MKITAVETIYLSRGITVHAGAIQYLWVRIHTDEGLIGLGESYPNAEAEAAIVHSRLAALLLGKDPSAIDRLWRTCFSPFRIAAGRGRKCVPSARSTSRCGICSARPRASRSISC